MLKGGEKKGTKIEEMDYRMDTSLSVNAFYHLLVRHKKGGKNKALINQKV